MKSPTEKTIEALAKLRASGQTFREIVDALKRRGHITSISHLSRIADGQRESSPELAAAMAVVVRSCR